MKKLLLALALSLLFSTQLFSQTHVSGTIDGETWVASGSPYIVDDDLLIASLVIEPGVTVMANGNYVIEVAGIIKAVGSIQDSIYFTTTDTINGWQGILFNVTTFDSELNYCKIEKSINRGIRVINSTPTIENCLIYNCSGAEGGAIYFFNDTQTGSEFTLFGCSFIGNKSSGHGGALSVSLTEGHIIIDHCSFVGNISNPSISTGNFVGGAIYMKNGDLTVLNSEFIGNISNSRCTNNTGCNVLARGGAIYLGSSGMGIIKNNIFLENKANAQNNGNCFFGGSSKSYGGAIYVNDGSISILNNVIAYNRTTRTNCGPSTGGGGVYVNGGDVHITNCNIVYNPDATGIHCAVDTLDVENTIIFFNNQEAVQVGGNCKINYSNIQDGYEGEGNISSNPVFIKDDSTFHLTSISKCIDAGDPNELYYDVCFPPSLGSVRNDMGAYGGPFACDWLLNETIIIENDLGIRWVDPIGKPLCGTSGEQPITVRVKNDGEYAVSNFKVGYSIDNGLSYVDETVFQSLAAGDSLEYIFKRKADMDDEDTYNCMATVSVPYDVNDTNDVAMASVESNRLICDISTSDTKCNEATGTAEVLNISGRQGPYELNWTTGDTDMKAENLESGVYFITIKDANGCNSVKSFTINDQGAPELSMDTKVNNISCFGMTDGSIDISPIGGTQPYNFRWSTGTKSEDVSDLVKGQYDVTITDANGCANNHSFYIEEPGPLKIKAESTDASCGEMNGIAELIAGGGTPLYSFTWDGKAVGSTVSALAGGLYTALVTDSKGCVDFTTVSVSEIDAPQILVKSVTPASCGQSDGGINISMADPRLQYSYLWSDASTTQDIQNVPSGQYSITVTNKEGSCSSSQVIEIPARQPEPDEICMVSVDSVSGENLIILKDAGDGGILSENIYLLGKTGSYQLLNTIDPNLTNTTLDAGSNTEITSYRYRITSLDACGNESEASDFHETMHVVATPDLNLKRSNIFWNSYKGADYDFFQIYRYGKESGFEIIDSVPKIVNKDFYTYTDLNPPLDDSIYYVIAIEMTESCNSFKKAGTHNTVRSNKTKKLKPNKSGASGIPELSTSLTIYPNPNQGTFYIDLGTIANQDIVLRIFDSQGRLIRILNYINYGGAELKKIELPDAEPGIYLLHLQLINQTMSRAIVIE